MLGVGGLGNFMQTGAQDFNQNHGDAVRRAGYFTMKQVWPTCLSLKDMKH